MTYLLTRARDILTGRAPYGSPRSPKWPAFRKRFLAGKVCAVCGGTKNLEAHHIQSFRERPDLELDETNLIPLCEAKGNGVNCHLAAGHLGNFRSINVNVRRDAQYLAGLIKGRPE